MADTPSCSGWSGEERPLGLSSAHPTATPRAKWLPACRAIFLDNHLCSACFHSPSYPPLVLSPHSVARQRRWPSRNKVKAAVGQGPQGWR